MLSYKACAHCKGFTQNKMKNKKRNHFSVFGKGPKLMIKRLTLKNSYKIPTL